MIETPRVEDGSMIYMYGISDFWSNMFGDSELVESILAAETVCLAEVYSYFLQRSAGISLSDVQERYKTRIKLLLIDESDAITDGDLTSFVLDDEIASVANISNRPILPTQVLDNNVHYEIDGNTITFHKPLNELKFAARYTSKGNTQYALWLTDVEIDEKWIDNSFGRLVGFTEEDAIFNYKSFLEGVYFLYANGPTIYHIERGVNLAMGMPYARATEQILDMRQDTVTGNWLVFTDTNGYEIPYGFRPELSVGGYVVEGEVLSTWVEIKDFTRNGEWWYHIYLPREVLNGQAPTDVGRCIEGSTGDMMMQNFLKHHMFEVLITQPNGDESSFNTARELVMRAKPEYTFPVFVWKVPVDDEVISIEYDMELALTSALADHCISAPSVLLMDRGSDNPESSAYAPVFTRGMHWYNRVQGSIKAATMLGYGDWDYNGGWAPEFNGIEERYQHYMSRTMRSRGDLTGPTDRNTVIRGWRGFAVDEEVAVAEGLDWVVKGSEVVPRQLDSMTFNDRDVTPLYMLSESEALAKLKLHDNRFQHVQGTFKYLVTGVNLVEDYDRWMIRSEDMADTANEDDIFTFANTSGELDPIFSKYANQAYIPKRSDMYDEEGNPIEDGMLFVTKNNKQVWSVQWVRNSHAKAPTLFPVEDEDNLIAIENYNYDNIGTDTTYGDVFITAGRESISLPVLMEEFRPIVLSEGTYIPEYAYDLQEDGRTLIFDNSTTAQGHITWVPRSRGDLVLIAGGDTYNIPDMSITDREDIMLVTSPVASNYRFIHDYSVAPDGSGGTNVILDDALPEGGDIIIIFTDHTDMPEADEFAVSGDNYTVVPGYTVKIFTESGILIPDSNYYIIGSELWFSTSIEEDFVVRYYQSISTTIVSPFNRSTVQRNQARFLMDRSRPDGVYKDPWVGLDGSGSPDTYMNRSGRAWLQVPEVGDTPIYADEINITRRL